MPTPKETNSVELGWNGQDGYCRNDGKYDLFYEKPDLGASIVYDTLFFSTNHPEDNYKTVNNVNTALTQAEAQIVHDYAVAHAVETPWTGQVVDFEILHAGDLTDTIDPLLDTWGNPTQDKAIITGNVVDEFVNAPTNIPAGDYRGILTKQIAPTMSLINYTTLSGRMYQKLKIGSDVGGWEELGVSAKEAIWTLKGNDAPTALTTANPVMLAADISKFNAVEQDFLGDLMIGSENLLKFTSGQSGAYQIDIHGIIEDSSTSVSKIGVSIFDSQTNEHLTGSMQLLAPASTWGGKHEFTFNSTGYARLNPSATISLQAITDVDANVVLRECIVVLKPIES